MKEKEEAKKVIEKRQAQRDPDGWQQALDSDGSGLDASCLRSRRKRKKMRKRTAPLFLAVPCSCLGYLQSTGTLECCSVCSPSKSRHYFYVTLVIAFTRCMVSVFYLMVRQRILFMR